MEKTLMQVRTDHVMNSGALLPEREAIAPVAVPRGYRRVTLNLPIELLDQLKNTVYWTPGVTLTGLIKTALCESLTRMEQRHGRPYPPRLGELKCGRPRKMKGGPRAFSSFPVRESRSGHADPADHGCETQAVIDQPLLAAEGS